MMNPGDLVRVRNWYSGDAPAALCGSTFIVINPESIVLYLSEDPVFHRWSVVLFENKLVTIQTRDLESINDE